ncbi:hypothetical protein, partial [Falsiroseomonas oryziterrae]|uniref:hypothetical protein n=1 Tax=Falsiroseomonas oryziterrae TaxID=2911368 RepID=UPI001F4155EB
LEARARAGGPDALAAELPLFAAPAPGVPKPDAPAGALHAALAELDPDTLSPREAHEALYRLRALLDPPIAAMQHDDTIATGSKTVS